VLGLWIEQNEGAKFWLRVMNELKNRGVDDIMLAVVDGLKGWRSEQARALVFGDNSALVSNGTADTAAKTNGT